MNEATAVKPLRSKNFHHLNKSAGNNRILGADALLIKDYPDLDTRAKAMHEDGFVAFTDVLDQAGVCLLRNRMEQLGEDDSAYFGQGNYMNSSEEDMKKGYFNKHIGCPFILDQHFLEYFDKPEIIEVVEAVHGPNCRVIGGSVWVTGPGRYPMGLHIDYQPIELPEDIALDSRVNIPVFISTAHFYLNDMFDELGPTVVVPGSHRAGRAPNNETSWRGIRPQSFTCNAGDALLFRSDLWHGALPNVSNERRYMLQVHYGNAYIDTSYQSPVKKRKVPDEVTAKATPRQRMLLGERVKEGPGSYIKEARLLPHRGRDSKIGT